MGDVTFCDMTDHALRLLRQDRRLAELAAFPFDFDLDRAAHGHVEEVRLASGGPLETVAGDDSGGTYFVCADGSVLYADSEGAAGIIGSSVDETLELVRSARLARLRTSVAGRRRGEDPGVRRGDRGRDP